MINNAKLYFQPFINKFESECDPSQHYHTVLGSEKRCCGCRVKDRTLSHVRPSASKVRGEVATIRGIGKSTILLFTRPTVKPVKPAIAA